MKDFAFNPKTFQISQFGVVFNQLNRDLMRAETPEAWGPAISSMIDFLGALDENLISHPEIIATDFSESSRGFSMLLTLIAIGSQYRLEQFKPSDKASERKRELIDSNYLPETGKLRQEAIRLAKKYLQAPVFDSLRAGIDHEIVPLLDSMDYEKDPNRWMPFRVVQIGNIYERFFGFRLRTQEPALIGDEEQIGLLRSIYERKYLRFGTSGVRGRWGEDFTEQRARQVAVSYTHLTLPTN